MSKCTNPECICQEIEPKKGPPLSPTNTERAMRSAGTKMAAAYDEIDRLIASGHRGLTRARANLHKAMVCFDAEHAELAARMGFTIKAGIGPGDWE